MTTVQSHSSPDSQAPSGVRPVMRAVWLGTVPYGLALKLQHKLLEQRKNNVIPDTLLLLEHPHVFTLGRRADGSHVTADEDTLKSASVEVVETDRGGEATYHGPGQLVAYPIVSIREAGLGPVAYVRLLEEAVIGALRDYIVSGHRVVGKTGVWVGGEPGTRVTDSIPPAGAKVAAMGVRVSSGVAMHGFALNVITDLSYFGYIVPCGMPGLTVASIASLTRKRPSVRDVGESAAVHLARLLGREMKWVTAEEIAG
ncbi:MAG: lipoyl(octanoyl) transferase LipB [Dehalococcoidia bacterium]|nr:lipoyl(octanoyl) transferase LipB [Dehalococcoidia bacterium]MSQ35478.1 lipoyl(octanoyl) transferase LipB [Dehalococcoidia bacterium]